MSSENDYLIVADKIYTLEPKETTPIHLTMPMKVVIYAGVSGVILLGVWPQPFIEFSVQRVYGVGGAVKLLSLLAFINLPH